MGGVVEAVGPPIDAVEAIERRKRRADKDATAIAEGQRDLPPVGPFVEIFVHDHRGDATVDERALAHAVGYTHLPRLATLLEPIPLPPVFARGQQVQ